VRLSGSVANADGLEDVDRHERTINGDDDGLDGNERRWRRWQSWCKDQSEAAFVRLARLLRVRGPLILASRQAHRFPQRGRNRSCVAHQRGVGERLEEIESDRKQRRGERSSAPTSYGLFAIHSKS
jgi:hypothetical protein